MSSEINRIIDQINRLYTGDAWLGTNLINVLDGIDEKTANQSCPPFKNTIHQIVWHVLATELVVMQRLAGNDYVLTPEEDWMPKDEIVKIGWADTMREFLRSKDELVSKLTTVEDGVLETPIIKDYSTIYVTLHGHIQHTVYHFGQISVIKQLVK